MDVVVCYEVTCRLIRMLLPKQLRTFPQSMQQPGQWAAHLIRGVDIPVACYTCTETLAQIYQRKKVLEEKTNRKRRSIFKMLRVPCGLPVIVANIAKTCKDYAMHEKCTSMLHILCKFLKTANILQCTVCFLQSAMNTTAQFADMIPYLATIMHCRC